VTAPLARTPRPRYPLTAHKLFYLMTAARHQQLSGVELNDEAPALPNQRRNELPRTLAHGYRASGLVPRPIAAGRTLEKRTFVYFAQQPKLMTCP